MRKIAFLTLLVLAGVVSYAQRTAVYTDKDAGYVTGEMYYDAKVYAAAMHVYDPANAPSLPPFEPMSESLRSNADFRRAQAAVRRDLPEAENMVLAFIRDNEPNPIASEASLEMAQYYFADRQYEKAIQYYGRLSTDDLSPDQREEVLFRIGYAHFVRKEYTESRQALAQASRNSSSRFYHPANYYLGMCHFIEGDYDSAVARFKKVEGSEEYMDYVPYYTSLLYFALRDFENVIAHGEPFLETRELYNEEEIRHLVGQAYFELKQYDLALPYLEHYEQNTGKMRPGEFYQLAYAQYQIGLCDKASETFKEIASLENPMGQRANFYIADCNLQTGNHREARNAFRSVSKMDYDPNLQQEALFNYGKLSAELNYDRDAIHTLNSIPLSSTFYPEAQEVLDDVFAYTQDHGNALAALDEIDELSPRLKSAYQRLSLMMAFQYMSDGNLKAADDAFVLANKYPLDASYTAQAVFWRAEIAHSEGRYADSRDLFSKYFTLARSVRELPIESSPTLANYTQGYNFLKQKSYGTALEHFERAVVGLADSRFNSSRYREQVSPDAKVRSADCLFKLNKYERAITRYDEVIGKSGSSAIYAQFQKAMILGLMDQPIEKIVLLEDIAVSHPKSQFADDALFQLAATYQDMGSNDKALPALRNLITYHPNSPLRNSAYLRLGLVSYNNGDLNSAIDYYKSVFNNNPTAGETQEALTALQEIYIQDLSSPDEYFAIAETLPGNHVTDFKRDSMSYRTAEIQFENAQYAKAIAAFDKYLDNYPKGANYLAAYYFRGESHALLEHYDEALRDYDAVAQQGNSTFYQKSLTKAASLSYHHAESFYAAYDYYLELSQISLDEQVQYDAQLGMMRSAYRSESWDKARIAGTSVLQHHDITAEEKAEAHYCIAKSAYANNDPDEALIHFNSVVEFSNNVRTAEARYTICKIYYDRGQLDLAEQLCFNANKDNTNYPNWVAKGLILLSDIYVGREDLFNAKAPLEALVESFQGDTSILEEARRKLDKILLMEQENSRLKAGTDSNDIDEKNNHEDR